MTRAERKKHTCEMNIANELDQHFDNGSGFIYEEPGGRDSPEEVIDLRTKILKGAVELFRKRAQRGHR